MLPVLLCVALAVPAEAPQEAPPAAPHRPDPGVAMLVSILGTAVPIAAGFGLVVSDGSVDVGVALLAGGLVVGPSVGHFYRGERLPALGFILGRTPAYGLGAYLFLDGVRRSIHEERGREASTLSGSLLLLSGVVLSLVEIGFVAERIEATVAPVAVQDAAGDVAPGLAWATRF